MRYTKKNIMRSPEEKERIVFDHYYKYYFDAYLKHGEYKELLQTQGWNVYGPDYDGVSLALKEV